MSDRDRDARVSGWQLARSGPEAYERYLVPELFAPWAERLVDRLDLRTGERVLDVGCGTGVVARRAAARTSDDGGTVVGLDVNEAMLEVAASTAAERFPAIDWRRGDATDLPFPDGAFDAVVCQQVLQFVPEPVAALREIARVLAPNGRFTGSVWRPLAFNPGYARLSEVLTRRVGDAAGAMMRSPFPDWTGSDLRAFARDAGFDDPSIVIEIGSMRYPSVAEFVRREAASSPLSEQLRDVERDVREALVEDARDALRAYVDDEGIVFPMESHVTVADAGRGRRG